ncbi:MAG TPA: DUF4339 domain-containing protein [Prosthecobacter sp.]|nr:DUF4339 domain-containing protein [Prosthecobacter sp.]
MSTEVIANIWTFVRGEHARELGVRLYMTSGTDNEKTAFLKALAQHDFRFAWRFPVPERFKSIRMGGHFGLDLNPLEFFKDTWDIVKKSLPVHRVGITNKTNVSAPLETGNLLSVYTCIEVDSDGNQRAHLPGQQVSGAKPTLLLNRWGFADDKSSQVFAVAGRAYLAAGSDQQLDALLAQLASDDYLLAPRFSVSSQTDVESSALLSHQVFFEPVIRDIENSVPNSFIDSKNPKAIQFSFRTEDARVKTTVVTENQNGKVATVEALAKSQPAVQPPDSHSPSIPPPLPKRFYAFISEQVAGPFTIEQIHAQHKASTVSDETLCCLEGTEDWTAYSALFSSDRTTWHLAQYAEAIAKKVTNTTPCEDSGLEAHRDHIRTLGGEVNEKFGFEGMQAVWNLMHNRTGAGPCSDLTRIWNGVGRWQK